MATDGDMRAKRRRSRLDGQVEEEISRLAFDKWTPAQIHRELKRLQDTQETRDGEVIIPQGCALPTLRTVERAVARVVTPDTSGPWWSLAHARRYDAALILPVLAEAIEQSGGRWQRFSKDLAKWIVKVRVAAPDLPVSWALNVAQAYRAAKEESDTEELEGLDQMLAFAPWRDEDHNRRYLRAVDMLHPEGWFLHFGLVQNGESEFAHGYYSPGTKGVLIASIGWSRQNPPRVSELEATMRLIEESDSDEEAPHD